MSHLALLTSKRITKASSINNTRISLILETDLLTYQRRKEDASMKDKTRRSGLQRKGLYAV